jgi:hypothetical protein
VTASAHTAGQEEPVTSGPVADEALVEFTTYGFGDGDVTTGGPVGVQPYEPGSWGPANARRLAEPHGWRSGE